MRVIQSDADSSARAPGRMRDLRLDLFRGIALFLIFIDYISGNVLSHFPIQSIGFSDAAEIFIFISGTPQRWSAVAVSSSEGPLSPQ